MSILYLHDALPFSMFVVLGYLGVKALSEGRTLLAHIATVFYFAYFITMPIWTSTHVKRTSIVSWIICPLFGVIFLVMTFQNLGGDVPFLVRLLSVAMAVGFIVVQWLSSRV